MRDGSILLTPIVLGRYAIERFLYRLGRSPYRDKFALKGKMEVEVKGFDYYNTRTGTVDSGGTAKIAMWLLDTDYDGRSLYPRQVFFPIADADGGWARLAKG